MDSKKLISWKNNPTLIGKEEIVELEVLLKDFPFLSLGQVLLAKGYKNTNHYKFDKQVKKAAMYCQDRTWLYHFLNQTEVIEEEIEDRIEEIEEKKEVVEPISALDSSVIEKEEEKIIDVREEDIVVETSDSYRINATDSGVVENREEVIEEKEILEEREEIIEVVKEPEMDQVEEIELAPRMQLDTSKTWKKANEKTILDKGITEPKALEKEVLPKVEAVAEEVEDIEKREEKIVEREEEKIKVKKDKNESLKPLAHIEKPIEEKQETISENKEVVDETSEGEAEQEEKIEKEAKPTKVKSKKEKKKSKKSKKKKEKREKTVILDDKVLLDELISQSVQYNIEEYFTSDEEGNETEEKEQDSEEMDFFAWLKETGDTKKPEPKKKPAKPKKASSRVNKTIDIIDGFLNADNKTKVRKTNFFTPVEMAKRSDVLESEIVSETLAAVYEEQEYYKEAILTYEKLILLFPQKEPYFATRIKELRKK